MDIVSNAFSKVGKELENVEAKVGKLYETGNALLSALDDIGYPMSDAAWANTGDGAPGNEQASVEARDLHRAAKEFRYAMEQIER